MKLIHAFFLILLTWAFFGCSKTKATESRIQTSESNSSSDFQQSSEVEEKIEKKICPCTVECPRISVPDNKIICRDEVCGTNRMWVSRELKPGVSDAVKSCLVLAGSVCSSDITPGPIIIRCAEKF